MSKAVFIDNQFYRDKEPECSKGEKPVLERLPGLGRVNHESLSPDVLCDKSCKTSFSI